MRWVSVLPRASRGDGEGVGDAVPAVVVGELGHRVQRSQSAGSVAPGHGVGAGGQGLAVLSAVGGVAGLFAVHHVGGDGEDRTGCAGPGGTGWYSAQGVVELLHLLAGDRSTRSSSLPNSGKSPSVSKSVTRPVSGSRMQRHLRVLHRGEGVRHAAHARDAEGHQPAHGRCRAEPSGSSHRRICRACSG